MAALERDPQPYELPHSSNHFPFFLQTGPFFGLNRQETHSNTRRWHCAHVSSRWTKNQLLEVVCNGSCWAWMWVLILLCPLFCSRFSWKKSHTSDDCTVPWTWISLSFWEHLFVKLNKSANGIDFFHFSFGHTQHQTRKVFVNFAQKNF